MLRPVPPCPATGSPAAGPARPGRGCGSASRRARQDHAGRRARTAASRPGPGGHPRLERKLPPARLDPLADRHPPIVLAAFRNWTL